MSMGVCVCGGGGVYVCLEFLDIGLKYYYLLLLVYFCGKKYGLEEGGNVCLPLMFGG